MNLQQEKSFSNNAVICERSAGFTLIEVIVVVAIIAILVAIAVPTLKDSLASSRMGPNANGLVGALNLARLEAIKRSEHVVVGQTTADNWNKGLSVWVDSTRNGTLDSSTETVLKKIPELEGTGYFTVTSGVTKIIFLSSGFISSSTPVTFLLCDNRSAETGRLITVIKSGQIRTEDKAC